jgi:thioredoxin-related protein
MRKAFVVTWLLVLLAFVVVLFWHYEYVYSLPTPVPQNYRNVTAGTTIDIARKLPVKTDKPVLLHFYNPDCPCSRFNIQHFNSLVKQYGNEIRFVIVPMTKKQTTATDILKKFDADIPVVTDTTLAAECGVYSTPQAVIIDTSGKLFFRGNYNKYRYCSDKRTEYARMAIDKLLHNNAAIDLDELASKAYGCQLPKCTKQ